MVPLPSQPQFGIIEIITYHQFRFPFIAFYRFFHNRRYLSIFIPQHRPTVFPTARHQYRHTSHCLMILEQHSIPLPFFGVNETSLCHTMIGISHVIRKNHLHLIRTCHLIRTETELGTDTTFRPPNKSHVILLTEFVEVYTFQQPFRLSRNDFHIQTIRVDSRQVIIKFDDTDVAGTVCKVNLTVIVEQHGGIMEIFINHQFLLPLAGRIFCRINIRFVARTKEYIEQTVMIAQ